MTKSDGFLRMIKLILIFMILVLVADLYLRHTADADSGPAEQNVLEENDTGQQLRQDLDRALAILATCFDTTVSLDRIRSVSVTLTAYTSNAKECDRNPHLTASAKPVRHGIVSVSVDLVREMGLKFGQRVLIPGYGIFQVEDRTNPRLRRTVDIWMADRKAALLFGRQQGTLFWIDETAGSREEIASAS